MKENIKLNRTVIIVAVCVSFLSIFFFFLPVLKDFNISMFDTLKDISIESLQKELTLINKWPMITLLSIQAVNMALCVATFVVTLIKKDTIKVSLILIIPIVILGLFSCGLSLSLLQTLGINPDDYLLGSGPIIYGCVSLCPLLLLQAAALINAIKMSKATTKAMGEYADTLSDIANRNDKTLSKQDKIILINQLIELKDQGIITEKQLKERIDKIL